MESSQGLCVRKISQCLVSFFKFCVFLSFRASWSFLNIRVLYEFPGGGYGVQGFPNYFSQETQCGKACLWDLASKEHASKNTRLADLPQGPSLLYLLGLGPGNSEMNQSQFCHEAPYRAGRKALCLAARCRVGRIRVQGEGQMQSHEPRRESACLAVGIQDGLAEGEA